MVSIPAATHIADIQLRVNSLAAASDFYKNILGFRELVSRQGEKRLSASGQEPAQVILVEDRNAPARKRSAPGLFHTAFLFPSRLSLAAILERLIEKKAKIDGFADHGVSEAVYLADPEGNGVELYRDRPKESWRNHEGEIAMVTEPLDVAGLLQELGPQQAPALEMDPKTVIGHIHLQVSDLGKAEKFYHQILGFDATQRSYPGALFLSAGGYHHHVGLNIWNSKNAAPAPGAAGLASFTIHIPDRDALLAIAERLEEKACPVERRAAEYFVVHDFDGIVVHLLVSQNTAGSASLQSCISQEAAS